MAEDELEVGLSEPSEVVHVAARDCVHLPEVEGGVDEHVLDPGVAVEGLEERELVRFQKDVVGGEMVQSQIFLPVLVAVGEGAALLQLDLIKVSPELVAVLYQ